MTGRSAHTKGGKSDLKVDKDLLRVGNTRDTLYRTGVWNWRFPTAFVNGLATSMQLGWLFAHMCVLTAHGSKTLWSFAHL